MKAWIYDDMEEVDQRERHDGGDSVPVPLSVLEKLGLFPRNAIDMEQVEIM